MPWRGALIDVGGVLQVGDRALPGAAEALHALRRRRVPFRLLSNTTSRSRRTLAGQLARYGLPVAPEDLLTATGATAAHLRGVGGASLFLVSPDAREDLAGLPEEETHPAHVVVGDTDLAFSRAAMTRALRALHGGADLVAMARNRHYASHDGPVADIGAVVAALEYCAGVSATLIGKPARPFFAAGVSALGLPAAEAVMVGDDPEADVVGAMDAGLGGVWVGERWPLPGRAPDARIDSVAELPALFG